MMTFSFSFKPLAAIGSVAALVVFGTTFGVQQIGPMPAAAAGTSVAVFSWGDNSVGELGNGSLSPTSSDQPASVLLPQGVTPTAIAGDNSTAANTSSDPFGVSPVGLAIGSDGNVYAWGDTSGPAGESDVPVVISLPSGVTPRAVSAGQSAAFVLGSDGHLYAWGDNTLGILGDGTTTSSTTPVQVSFPAGVTPSSIAAGFETAYAIGSDGHLYAWGDNFYDELGDGGVSPQTCSSFSVGCSTTPVEVSLPAGVTPTSISAGGGFALATGSDGNLYAWGDNADGQLGNGTTTQSTTPVQVELPGVTPTAISAGGGFALAIGSDGNLYAWGQNTNGQLGNGTTNESTTPVQVLLPAGVTPTTISACGGFALAIGSDGNLYAWGANSLGELGDGSTVDATTPVKVALPSGSNVQKLGPEPGAITGYAIVSASDVAPSVTTQPSDQSVFEGTNVNFSAAASGFPEPTVQWQQSTDGGTTWSDVPGATSNTYSINDVPLADNGFEFRAVFTNGTGSATTDPATLTVNPTVAPVITTQPSSQSVPVGTGVTFSAAASGEPPPTVQWQLSPDGGSTWIDISGATSDTESVSDVTASDNGFEFRAVYTNSVGTATTNAATLTVTAPAPTTSVLLPSSGATVSGDIFLNAVASSPVGIALVTFEVSGGSITDQVLSSAVSWRYGWLGAWDTTDVPNGTYTVQSVATDNLGQSTTSAPITVTVANQPLATAVLVPSNGATLSGSSAVLDASASGTSDVTGVQFVINGVSSSYEAMGPAVATIYGWLALWSLSGVPAGSYTIESIATQSGGGTATSTPVTVTVS